MDTPAAPPAPNEMDASAPIDATKRTAKPALSLVRADGALRPTPRRFRLNSLNGVRAEMAAVYRAVRTGLVDSSEGSKLTYMLAQIGKVTVDACLEDRITELEKLEGHRNEY